ncbi:MAG: hypothetical protein ABWX74_04855 [Aeromicrobium sp.]
MRISRGRLAALSGIAAVVVVIIVLLTRGGGDDDDPERVVASTSQSYPARGASVDDDVLVDDAARAWRDDARSEDEDARPGARIEVLYAGRMAGEELSVTGPDRDAVHDVVVLTSDRLVATVARPKGGDWEVRKTVNHFVSVSAAEPLLDLGMGVYLVAADRFGDQAPAVRLPRELDKDEEVSDDEAYQPRVFTADLSDPLWAPEVEGDSPVVLRIPGDQGEDGDGLVWLDWDPDRDFGLLTRSTGGDAGDAQLWDQLVSPRDSAGTTAAFRAAMSTLGADASGNGAFQIDPETGVRLTSFGSATLRDTPDADQLANALAVGFGSDGGAQTIAVGLTGKDVRGDVRTKALVLGERPAGVREIPSLAAKWITAEIGGRPYLVYAADPALGRLQLRVGAAEVETDGLLGFYQAPVSPDDDGRLPTSLIGFDESGVSFQSFPIVG